MSALLDVSGLSAGYANLSVVFDASLSVAEGEYVGVVGSNGAGKSTLLGAIAGTVRSKTGEIRFNDARIDSRRPEDIVRDGLALVPEGRHIFAELTVEENLRLGLTARRIKGSPASVLAEVGTIFPMLETNLHRRAGLLSGGQQQQLAIARALLSRPRLLLLDEPSLGLSPVMVADLFAALDGIRQGGTSLVVVEQRAHFIIGRADRTLVVRGGRVRDELTPADVHNEHRLSVAYFGGEVSAP